MKPAYTVLLLTIISAAQARVVNVSSIPALQTAIGSAVPGDTILVANGTYVTSGSVIIARQGSPTLPITVMAQTTGGVTISGTGGLSISNPAAYVIVRGFRFTHATGTANIAAGATRCAVTRNLFECAPSGTGNKPYLGVSGDDNEISYNTFQNKSTEGCMLTIQGPGGDRMAKRTWIHHNYFHNFLPSGANNSSAIQIGLSGRSMDSAFTVVEYNLFSGTRGENEGAICHKSCKNVIRYNTFGAETEELSLRHGNRSVVYGNFFMGSTGLRFSGDDHRIYSNLFVACPAAIVCTNGDGEVAEGSALTCHDRPDRVEIVYNTLVNCAATFQEPSRTGGLGATSITFANNILQGGGAVSIRGGFTNPTWAGNILWNLAAGDIPASGYASADPRFSADGSGVYHLSAASPAAGAGTGSYLYVTTDIDGQPRSAPLDAGADELSAAPANNRVLGPADVGPNAGTPVRVLSGGSGNRAALPGAVRMVAVFSGCFRIPGEFGRTTSTICIFDLTGARLQEIRLSGSGSAVKIKGISGHRFVLARFELSTAKGAE